MDNSIDLKGDYLFGRSPTGPTAVFAVDEDIFSSWQHIPDAVAGGGKQTPFELAHGGTPAFEYFGKNRRVSLLFDRAMAQQSLLVIKKLVEHPKVFDGVRVLVDVGGGTGEMLALIRDQYKHIRCINMDLPHSDEESILILKCLPDNGKVIVTQSILPKTPESTPAARDSYMMDIIIYVNFKGGKDRTEQVYAKLGFSGFQKTYIFCNIYALEFTK
ncbi:caffeate O-methyltransferase-like protein 2 [Setaria viridis]|uniref:caffeate O-methyltransferase-like protein 2 n=1 Tax=Setaria viridis TaxID=4556 RepID=UPI0014933FD8|nr:caffeate O-methyltransferase-like protein 2 [Setaria viridis]